MLRLMLQHRHYGVADLPRVLTIGCAVAAFAVMMGGESVAAAVGATGAGWLGPEVQGAIDAGGRRFAALVAAGFERQPAAMLAVGGAAAVPLMALLVATGRLVGRIGARSRARIDRTGKATLGDHLGGGAAWIEVENQRDGRLAIGELTRIGRSDDCDLALGDASVDHTHALIRRTPDCEFIILDVSANDGTGMAINGRRLRQGTLRDGDCIELGSARMVFHQASTAGVGDMGFAA